MFNKGDIILPSSRVARKDWLDGLYHPAVVWDDFYEGSNDFNGVMLTHSGPNGAFGNILMAVSHFESGHEVGYTNTLFVNRILMKFQKWGPFELVGKLTSEGVNFIGSHLNENSPQMDFTTYRQLVKH